jgi:hypothetical protein
MAIIAEVDYEYVPTVDGRRVGDQAASVARTHSARLTSGGPTWDLRPPRNPDKRKDDPRPPLRTQTDVRALLTRNIERVVQALSDGRESAVRDLLQESRYAMSCVPGPYEEERRQLRAAETLLRSKAWRTQAARVRHGRR